MKRLGYQENWPSHFCLDSNSWKEWLDGGFYRCHKMSNQRCRPWKGPLFYIKRLIVSIVVGHQVLPLKICIIPLALSAAIFFLISFFIQHQLIDSWNNFAKVVNVFLMFLSTSYLLFLYHFLENWFYAALILFDFVAKTRTSSFYHRTARIEAIRVASTMTNEEFSFCY